MKKLILFVLLMGCLNLTKAQSLYFPPIVGTTWDTLSPSSLGWCQDKIDTLLNYLEDRNSKAFILLKDGKIVIEKYFGTFTQDSIWYWASAGKSLTSFTVGIAQQEGHLSISDTSSQYLGNGWTVAPAIKEDMITIRHQLTMTTGLDDGVADYTCTLPSCLQYLSDAGTRWAYHNGPYTLLDSVIYYSTSQSLNSYVTQKVLNPTGMAGLYFHTGYDNVFYSKPRSMARFGLLALNKGNWDGNQIMTDTAYFNQMVNTSQLLNTSYGYLWWLNGKSNFMVPTSQIVFPGPLNPSAPDDMFAAIGKNGQLINVVPSMNLVFIRMGNSPGFGGAVSLELNDTIWQKLNNVMCNIGIDPASNVNTNIQIYPNPTSDYLNIECPNQNFTVSIVDAAGKSLIENRNTFNRSTLDMSNLLNGIYFVRILTESGETYFRKMIKTH